MNHETTSVVGCLVVGLGLAVTARGGKTGRDDDHGVAGRTGGAGSEAVPTAPES